MRTIILLLAFFFCACQPIQREEPTEAFFVTDTTAITDPTPPENKPKYGFMAMVVNDSYSRKRFTTEVTEITDTITEDYKYRELDLAESNLRDIEYDNNDNVLFESREFHIFDSYKEASIERQNILNQSNR